MPSKTFTRNKSTLLAKTGSTSLGGGKDLHLPAGYNGGYKMRGAVQFNLNWTGVTQITSAKLWMYVTSGKHLSFGSDPDVYVRRITSGSWSPNSAASSADNIGKTGWTSSGATFDDIAASTSNSVTWDVPTSTGTWRSVDITGIVENWAPSTVLKSGGVNYGNGESNWGILIRPVNEGSGYTSENIEFRSGEDWGAPYIVLNYTSTTPPTTTPLYWVGGAIVADPTPTLAVTVRDEDGDYPDAVNFQIDDNSDFSSTLWNHTVYPISPSSGGEPEETTFASTYSGGGLPRGTTLYWRARASDENDGWGDFCATQNFKLNQLPTVSGGDLSNSRIVDIHNLSDIGVWSGSEAKPKFTWDFSDADGDSQQAFQVQVGTDGVNNNVADSGEVSSTNKYWNCDTGVPRDTVRYWRVKVKDSRGEWGNWSSWYTFKVQWAQSIYEHSVSGGTASSQWAFSSTTAGNATTQFASATGTSGTGRGSWNATIGGVSPNAYLNVLVRLGAQAGGSQSTISDMTFTYSAAGLDPDNWDYEGSSQGDWTLDSDTRRFGSRSLKFQSTSTTNPTWAYARPYRVTAGDGFSVTPGTTYTASCYIKTNGALSNLQGRLELRSSTGSVIQSTEWVDDSDTDGVDGWQRVSLTYTVPGGTTSLQLYATAYQNTTTAGDTLWFDALQFEEGTVASAWSPGLVSKAIVVDNIGIQIDGEEGGSFKLKDSTGDNIVSLGSAGLNFKEISSGNNTDLYQLGTALFASNGIQADGDSTIVGSLRATSYLRSDPSSGESALYLDRSDMASNGHASGRIYFRGGSGDWQLASILGVSDGQAPASGDSPGQLRFYTTGDGSSIPTPRIVVDRNGHLYPYTEGPRLGLSNLGWTEIWHQDGEVFPAASVTRRSPGDWTVSNAVTEKTGSNHNFSSTVNATANYATFFDVTTNAGEIRVLKAGKYRITANTQWNANGSTGRMQVTPHINGTEYTDVGHTTAHTGHGYRLGFDYVDDLAANSDIGIAALHNAGSNMVLTTLELTVELIEY